MKLVVQRNKFLGSLKGVCSIIDSNNYNPLLTSIYIECQKNKVILIGTNGNVSYKETIIEGVNVVEEGKILIKAKVFYSILSKLDEEEVSIKQIDNSVIEIKTTNYSCNINALDFFSFPIIDFNYEKWEKFVFDKKQIAFIINKITLFAVPNYDNKINILNGVNFASKDGDMIEAIATDGFKLGFFRFANSSKTPCNFTINVDVLRTINDMIISRQLEEIELYVKEKNAIFKLGDVLITLTLFTNEYPNIKNVLFKNNEFNITLKAKDLSNALNRGSMFSTTERRPIVLIRLNENKKLDIDFSTEELGSSHEEINITETNVTQYDSKFNQYFLSQILSCHNDSEIVLKFNGENQPVIINSKIENYLNLILPIKIA